MNAPSRITSAAIRTDPFLLEIIRSYLSTTCQEMGTTMIRTSFSPIFNEARDFIVTVMDGDAELLAQAEYVPAMIGSARHATKLALHEVGIETLKPGDIIVTNDPFRANNHLPEHMLIAPIFHEGRIISYVSSIGHMVDVGGTVAAAFGIHESVFHEGMRVPPVLLFREGEIARDVIKIMLANTRTPQASYGDLQAMVSALRLGEKRIHELVANYGLPTFQQACKDIKTVSEKLMRQQIAAWPNGIYEVEDVFDSDGVTPDRFWRLQARLVIRDDDIIIDFTGSDPAPNGSMALTYGSCSSAGYEAVFQMSSNDIPINEGSYRCIKVIAPYGSVVNADYPHATMAGNSEGQPVVIDMLIRAFSQFSDEAPASDGNSCGIVALGGIDPRSGLSFAHLNLEGTGWGGSAHSDGNTAQYGKLANCAVQSIEVLETRFPIVHAEYELQSFRGGAGTHRGGFGTRRTFNCYGENLLVSATVHRTMQPAPGIRGGMAPPTNVIQFRSGDETAFTTAMEKFGAAAIGMFANIPMGPSDQIQVITANGGGYGDPMLRDPDLVAADCADGLLSEQQAEQHFGTIIVNSAVDREATANVRTNKK